MGPQRKVRIYVGYESPTIIRYLEPKSDDIFTAQFVDCHFNEAIFSALWEKKQLEKEITWSEPSLLHLDPHTIMQVRSAKDYAFTRNSKSIVRSVH